MRDNLFEQLDLLSSSQPFPLFPLSLSSWRGPSALPDVEARQASTGRKTLTLAVCKRPLFSHFHGVVLQRFIYVNTMDSHLNTENGIFVRLNRTVHRYPTIIG